MLPIVASAIVASAREPRQVVPLVRNVPAKPDQAHPALSGPGAYSGLGRDTKR
jgi:hypothetical protein